MMRLLKTFLLTALVGHPLAMAAAPIPEEWSRQDYPARPPQWYGVEVARFPSKMLASGVESSMQEAGWGPVLTESAESSYREKTVPVILGEMDNLGQAWFLQEELDFQEVAEGRLVPLATKSRSPRGFTGDLSQPFAVEFEGSDAAFQENLRDQLENLVRELNTEDASSINRLLELMESGEPDNPAAARGAMKAAWLFWERQVSPDAALYLASRVATGQWPTGPEHTALRQDARNLVFKLLYGHRRDFRGSWFAAREMLRLSENDPAAASLNTLRQAALLVMLIEQNRQPAPSFQDVRRMLREAYEMAPTGDEELRSRIELVYLQTFAWQGRWDRVEALSRGMIARFPAKKPYSSMARIYLAQSLERKRMYPQAVALLDQVIENPTPVSQQMRFGMERLDPVDVAREQRMRFRDLMAMQGRPANSTPGEPDQAETDTP